MVASVASFGSLNLTQGLTARAVLPAAVAPVLQDQPRPPSSPSAASHLALAPAAMTVLMEAQERLGQDVPWVARQDAAQKIDQLIDRLNERPSPAEARADVPFAMRRLIVVRQALSESLIDLQA